MDCLGKRSTVSLIVGIILYIPLQDLTAGKECGIDDIPTNINDSDVEPLMLNKFNAFKFGYRMICNAKIVSVKAYGFCPRVNPNTTVQMHLRVTHWSDEGRITHDIFLEAECNSNISIYNYSSGSVSNDSLNISVLSGDFLTVEYFKNCSSKTCLFHPAFTRKKGSLPAYFSANNSVTGIMNYSLLLSAVIEKTEEGRRITTGQLISILIVSFLFLTTFIAACSVFAARKIVKQRKKKTKNLEEERPKCHYDYVQDVGFERYPVTEALYDSTVSGSNQPFQQPTTVEHELTNQLENLAIEPSSLVVKGELGVGEFGVVRKGVWSVGSEEREVAVKSLADGSTEEKRIQFLQEAVIMSQFTHPNVITLYGVLLEEKHMMILVELMKIGDLLEHLSSLKPSDEREVLSNTPALLLSFCRQIVSGMTYLSGKGFIHRDLAARNILLSHREVCKIADFGMSRALFDTDYYISRGGKIPVKWTAPEALHYKKYSTASDVWSFGVVLYEIWSFGAPPYLLMTNNEVYEKIEAGSRLPPPPGCPRTIYTIMIHCWNPAAELRPSFSNIQVELQQPDFKVLTWTPEDVAGCCEEARTLGAPLEVGEELYTDLQQYYAVHD